MPALFQIKIVILFVPTPFFRSIYLCLWERLLFGVCWCFASRRPPRRRWPPAHTTPLPSSFAPPPPKKKNKREEDGVLKTLAAWVAEKETMLRRKGLPSADDFGLLFIFFPERRMTDYWPSRFSPVVSTVAALRVVYFPTGVCCSWIASWLAATVRNGFVGCYEEMSEIALRNETTRTRKNRG